MNEPKYICADTIVVLVRAGVRPYWVARVKWLHDAVKHINEQFMQTELFGYEY